mmetsp:Transcript_37941/g.58003  ORF Transcript_37941/g.58003 Transcript_37941/m.58003 type:complete len:214 (-) Transcript_37941:1957-2598(-)
MDLQKLTIYFPEHLPQFKDLFLVLLVISLEELDILFNFTVYIVRLLIIIELGVQLHLQLLPLSIQILELSIVHDGLCHLAQPSKGLRAVVVILILRFGWILLVELPDVLIYPLVKLLHQGVDFTLALECLKLEEELPLVGKDIDPLLLHVPRLQELHVDLSDVLSFTSFHDHLVFFFFCCKPEIGRIILKANIVRLLEHGDMLALVVVDLTWL